MQKGFLRHDILLYWKLKTEMKDTQFPLFVKSLREGSCEGSDLDVFEEFLKNVKV